MTDVDLLLKKLAFIETCLMELRTLSKLELLETDVKERRFVEHTLQVCLQAVQDVASHIVADERLGEPSTNQQLFQLLQSGGWLEVPLSDALRACFKRSSLIRLPTHPLTNVSGPIEAAPRNHEPHGNAAASVHARGRPH